jgi:hypothetical protein
MKPITKKTTRKSYPWEYKLKALTFCQVGVFKKESKKGASPEQLKWECISQDCTAQMLGICSKQLWEWQKHEDLILGSSTGLWQITKKWQL